MPWLRWSAARFSPQRPRFMPVSVHVGYVVDKVTLGQVFLHFGFSLLIPYHCGSPYSYITLWMNNRHVGSRSSDTYAVSPHQHEHHYRNLHLAVLHTVELRLSRLTGDSSFHSKAVTYHRTTLNLNRKNTVLRDSNFFTYNTLLQYKRCD
jgi:hypothetical protein